ncbi:MAG: DNA-processing protein DprA [Oscillospiraceae bacterium]|nr:DNA-processing protein DprA [Oscillospiraceae bacterium]
MLVHWIWLAIRSGMSDRVKAAVLEHFGDPEDAFYADRGAYKNVEGLTVEDAETLEDKSLASAQKILAQCVDKDIHILTYRDAAYPARLKNISDPPLVLYYKGRLPDFDGQPLIAVVGTRKASGYGLTAAKRMGYQIAQCGGVVVSGMAFGIDGVAMTGALSAGGTVVGVLGCGADVVYPLSNRALFADTERRGCLLTEFPPGTPPNKWHFPKRNRIISGLSCGVLVVEAPKISGALITARQAADQGRDVFVVPGNIDVDTCEGSNALLREGAILARTGWDILSEYQAIYPEQVRKFDRPGKQSAYPEELERLAAEGENKPLKVAQTPRLPNKKPVCAKKDIDNGSKPLYSDVEKSLPRLTAEEQQIVDQLKQGQRLRDDVIAHTGLSAASVAAALTMLEVKGVIRRLPGNMLELK